LEILTGIILGMILGYYAGFVRGVWLKWHKGWQRDPNSRLNWKPTDLFAQCFGYVPKYKYDEAMRMNEVYEDECERSDNTLAAAAGAIIRGMFGWER
jgi:hypothetical protein